MEETILNGVGKKMRNDYLNGQVPASSIIAMYKKNKKEADSFSAFGYRQREIEAMIKDTHNPLLKQKLLKCLEAKRENSTRSKEQNEVSLAKLEVFKKEACGMGLRKVIKKITKMAKKTKDAETRLLLLLLETEYANLSAKQHKGELKKMIYERKAILLYQMAEYLENLGWKYGINDEAGKNACYLVYIYLPNGVQLTWHCNEFDIYERYPTIDAEWDGQACMTMDKIISYIDNKYFHNKLAA